MKNRDYYILKKNEYDLLSLIQSNILSSGVPDTCCVIELLGVPDKVLTKICADNMAHEHNCYKCIEKWLNMEVEL